MCLMCFDVNFTSTISTYLIVASRAADRYGVTTGAVVTDRTLATIASVTAARCRCVHATGAPMT